MSNIGYALFVRRNRYGNQAKVLKNPSFARIKKLESEGFELVTDELPSEEAAHYYASLPDIDAYAKPCSLCGQYVSTIQYRGRIWGDDRWNVFNGRICDQCLSDRELAGEIEVKEVIK